MYPIETDPVHTAKEATMTTLTIVLLAHAVLNVAVGAVAAFTG
jgi:hypothetical protein